MTWRGATRPVRAALIGSVIIAAVLATAVVGPAVHLRASTDEYHAELANASALQPDDPVYVAGVPTGRVLSVERTGDRVTVGFRLDAATTLGTATRAEVKLRTILGRRYLSVQPAGSGVMRPGQTIPLGRTTVPYVLDDLGRQAASTTEQLDLPKLRKMLSTVSDVLPQDSGTLRRALRGVSAASKVVSDNERQLNRLLSGARDATTALLDQRDTLVQLMGNADLVLRTLVERKDTVSRLLSDVSTLTKTANEFLSRHGDQAEQLLRRLHSMTGTLAARKEDLASAVDKLGPTARYLANATGNGNWADVAGPAGPLPDNLLCAAGLVTGCR